MVSYKDLGLVNTREMFAKAVKGGYAIPAFNFNNMEQLQAIIQASAEEKSPVILQVSKGARNYANQTLLRYMAEGAVQYAKELGWEHPQIVLHLDHGDSFELCKSCVDMGSTVPPFLTRRTSPSPRRLLSTLTSMTSPLRPSLAFSPALRMRLPLRSLTTQSQRRSSTSLPAQAATHSPSPSVPLTVPTSSSRSSAQETLRQAVSFHLHSLSTFSTRSRRSSLDSLSYSTDHLQFLRNMSISSTSTVASFLTL